MKFLLKFITAAVLLCVTTLFGIITVKSQNAKINYDLSALLSQPASAVSPTEITAYSTVNINTATVDELCTLRGIGEAKANSIIDYRQNNGGFIAVEEIMQVKGISEDTYKSIKDSICV